MKVTLGVLVICAFLKMHQAQTEKPVSILGGINNVAASATNFLTGVVNGPRELLHRVTDTAADYVVNAVETPRNLLMNATRFTTNYIDSATSKGLEFKLRTLLEKFRIRMREGMPDAGIPILDPLFISHYDLNTHNEEIGDVSGFVDNVTVRGASTFIVDHARLSLIGPMVTLNLTVPKLYATGHYNITGKIGNMFNIYGNGPFTAMIYNAKLYLNTVLGYSRGVYMKSFDLDFSIDSININLRNFMGNEKYGRIMNEVFQEMTPKALEIIKPEILPQIQNYISNRANDTLYHLTTRDVINFLTGKIDLGDLQIVVG